MNANRRRTSRPATRRTVPDAYDEADWVDWDHWQTVEEIQDFMNGLGGRPDTDGLGGAEDGNGHVARQIRRYGLEIEG